MSDDTGQEGWDALFGVPSLETSGGPARAKSTRNPLQRFLDLPGVLGAVRVALDGTIQGAAGDADAEQDAALAAFLGAAGGQLGQTLGMGGLSYCTLTLGGEKRSILLLRQTDAFLGLFLDTNISPTHVIARLQDLKNRT